MNKLLTLALVPLLLVGCERSRDVDNTERNVRDRDMKTLTPGDQKEDAVDRTITQNIRKAIMADSTLSANAENIKIITINGRVTLRGVVNSDAEKASIQDKAQAVVSSAGNVDNQLEVKKMNK